MKLIILLPVLIILIGVAVYAQLQARADGIIGINFVKEDAAETYYAESIDIIEGTLGAGILNSTYWADGDYYDVNEDTGTPALDIRFNFTGVNGIDFIVIKEKYDDGGSDIYVQLYNWNTSVWDTKFIISAADDYQNLHIQILAPEDYINQSNVSARYYQSGSGNPTYYISTDIFVLQKGISMITTNEHDSLSGRNSPSNHPWAVAYTYLASLISNYFTKTESDDRYYQQGNINLGGNSITNGSASLNLSGSSGYGLQDAYDSGNIIETNITGRNISFNLSEYLFDVRTGKNLRNTSCFNIYSSSGETFYGICGDGNSSTSLSGNWNNTLTAGKCITIKNKYNNEIIKKYCGLGEGVWVHVVLNSPDNDYINPNLEVTFSFNVTSEVDLQYCDLYMGGVFKYRKYLPSTGTNTIFAVFGQNFTAGWYIQCKDDNQNTGISPARTITIGGISGVEATGRSYASKLDISPNQTEEIVASITETGNIEAKNITINNTINYARNTSQGIWFTYDGIMKGGKDASTW